MAKGKIARLTPPSPDSHATIKAAIDRAVEQIYVVLMVMRSRSEDGGTLDCGEIHALLSIVSPVQEELAELSI